jgi:uncharacterized membrane protein YgaE (UPF0421/DUF939 family)
MFESRLQAAQVWLFGSFLVTVIGILVLIFGPPVVGVFCVVVGHAAAAAGCYLYADVKGYPGLIGIPLGVGVGFAGAILILILPDQTQDSAIAREKRLARLGMRPSRRKDPGYQVLDDDDD